MAATFTKDPKGQYSDYVYMSEWNEWNYGH